MTISIHLSEPAIRELKRIASFENKNFFLLSVKKGGCSGLTYVFELSEIDNTLEIINFDGFQVGVNGLYIEQLNDLKIDFADGLNNRGFTFENPNAKDTCGCGTSFN
ncbi:MAG: iron-sulfur cluster assembly accessory protein [Chitinophagales bacterium]|jgi:iron-sulfur cluster assembly protein|nr:iron-sulfur cluster assembly accessory protein [Chitinophagales bacterium]